MVDATLGLGGHTEAVLTDCPLARVIGIDRDPAALELAGERLRPFGDRFTAVHAVYDELPTSSPTSASTRVDAVLFDLGVSSMQLDLRERGFAYSEDAPLDMRMDGTTGPTAADVLNTYPAAELARVLQEYGEERFARRIAARRRARARARAVHHLGPAGRAAVRRDPGAGPAHRGTPCQAHLPGAADGGQRRARRAPPGDPGRHRRDQRSAAGWSWSPTTRWRTALVKQAFAAATAATSPRTCRSCPQGSEPALRLVTRGAEKADQREIAENPRAASVRLRAVERVSNPPRSRIMSSSAVQLRTPVRIARGSPRRPSSGPGSPSYRGGGRAPRGCRS